MITALPLELPGRWRTVGLILIVLVAVSPAVPLLSQVPGMAPAIMTGTFQRVGQQPGGCDDGRPGGVAHRLADRHAFTIVLVTHDPAEVTGLCSYTVVLETGALCESGQPDMLLADPVSATLRAFRRRI